MSRASRIADEGAGIVVDGGGEVALGVEDIELEGAVPARRELPGDEAAHAGRRRQRRRWDSVGRGVRCVCGVPAWIVYLWCRTQRSPGFFWEFNDGESEATALSHALEITSVVVTDHP